jgi:hypothetical protein
MAPARSALALVLALAASGCAERAAPATAAKAATIDPAPPPTSVEAIARMIPTAESPDDARRAVSVDLAKIAADGNDITRRVAEKRRARDVIWVLCLNDKLNQIHMTERSAREHVPELGRAIDDADAGGIHNQRTRIAVLRTHADELVREADACVAYGRG